MFKATQHNTSENNSPFRVVIEACDLYFEYMKYLFAS